MAGRVKTRLGRDIGMTDAAWWFRHQSRALIRRLRDPKWELVLAVSPDVQGMNSRFWPSDLPRLPQASGDLGQRMARALRAVNGPAILIGADIPDITRHHIARAFDAFAGAECVVGPTEDGGFWLIGLKHPRRQPPGFLEDVRWSSHRTLDDTVPSLPRKLAFADRMADVDDAGDLARLSAKHRDLPPVP